MRSALLFAVLAVPAAAQPPADPPLPAPPAGWRAVDGKDLSYQVFFPAKTTRTGTRDRTFRSGRLSYKVQLNYCVTPDGLTLTAEAINLGGAAVRGAKADDVYQLVADTERQDGYDVLPLTKTTVGGRPGAEYTATKGTEVRRVVMTGGRPRVYVLTVSGSAANQLTGPTAQTFVGSLTATPNRAVTAAKDNAVKDKAATEKAAAGDDTAPPWTLSPAKMTFPDKPVYGRVMGKPFVADKASFTGGRLVLRAGADFFADAEIGLALFLKFGETLDGRTFTVAPGGNAVGKPHLLLSRMDKAKGDRVPKHAPGLTPYALRLEFGQAVGGKVPGKIYLSANDPDKTVVAGTFEAEVK